MCISDHNFLSNIQNPGAAKVIIVLRIGKIIVPLSDTSIKLSMQVEFSLRNIFSYRAISDFSLEKIRAY